MPYVIDQLREYRRLGLRTLVVDSSPTVSAERRRDWERHADHWFKRANVGYDFASYREGALWLQDRVEVDWLRSALLLTNDSCFGPFAPVDELFAVQPLDPPAVQGVTDSWEVGHHLQSYWLYFSSPHARVACDFLSAMSTASDRADAIRRGELAISAYARSRGLVLRAHCPVARTIPLFAGAAPRPVTAGRFAARIAMRRYEFNRKTDVRCLKFGLGRRNYLDGFNPTFGFGVQLCQRGLSPFLKKALLRDNPYADKSIPAVADVNRMTNEAVASLLHIPQTSLRR